MYSTNGIRFIQFMYTYSVFDSNKNGKRVLVLPHSYAVKLYFNTEKKNTHTQHSIRYLYKMELKTANQTHKRANKNSL